MIIPNVRSIVGKCLSVLLDWTLHLFRGWVWGWCPSWDKLYCSQCAASDLNYNRRRYQSQRVKVTLPQLRWIHDSWLEPQWCDLNVLEGFLDWSWDWLQWRVLMDSKYSHQLPQSMWWGVLSGRFGNPIMKTQAGQPILGGLIRMDYCCHIFPPNRPLETCICMGIHVYTLAGLEIFGQLTSGSYIKRDICSYFGPQPKACIDMDVYGLWNQWNQ